MERCAGRFAAGPEEQGRQWRESGVVVTLEVPGTDSWLSHALREARGIPHQGAGPGTETEGLPAAELAGLLEKLSTVTAPPRDRGRPRRRHG